jgi:hypothetical protein
MTASIEWQCGIYRSPSSLAVFGHILIPFIHFVHSFVRPFTEPSVTLSRTYYHDHCISLSSPTNQRLLQFNWIGLRQMNELIDWITFFDFLPSFPFLSVVCFGCCWAFLPSLIGIAYLLIVLFIQSLHLLCHQHNHFSCPHPYSFVAALISFHCPALLIIPCLIIWAGNTARLCYV